MSLFVGRLPTYDFDDRDLEDIFYKYGRIVNCQLKRGSRFSFGFVEFEDPEDAYDAIRDIDGLDIDGVRIVVEKAKGSPRDREDASTCYNCGGRGHWARHCSRRSRRYSRSYSRSRSPYERYRRDYSRSRSSSYSRSRSPRRRSRSRTPTRRHYSRSRSPSRG